MSKRPVPASQRSAPAPPDPRYQRALLRIFAGHPMEAAVRDGRFALGLIERDRPAADALLAEMEADPEAARRRYSGFPAKGGQ